MTIILPLFSGRLATSIAAHDIRSGRNAREDSFLFRQPPGHGKGVVIGDLNALDDLRLPLGSFRCRFLGTKPAPGALNLVRAGLQRLAGEGLRNDRRILRLDRDGLEGRLARLDDFDSNR